MDDGVGLVRCTLLDRRSSVPLAGARVMCVARDGRVTVFTADERGGFAATLPEAVYDLVISARGYLSLTVRGIGVLAGHDQDVTRGLVPGEGRTLESEPATAIAGYVRDRIGHPIGNVVVHVNAEDGGTAYTTRTDRRGAYILNGVVAGTYDLAVRSGERTLALEHLPIAHVKDLVRRDVSVVQH